MTGGGMSGLEGLSLETILARCAYMRNVAMLPHRTLIEFGVFVQLVMRRENGFEEYHKRASLFVEHDGSTNQDRVESVVLQWGRLFFEYCEREYGEWSKEDDRFFTQLNSLRVKR
jgi:hypothetical protein